MGKFCVNCGKELDEEDLCCANCGTMVDGSPNPSISKDESVIKAENNDSDNKTSTSTNTSSTKKPGNTTNSLAIAGFVVSLVSTVLCCGAFNVISLILSIIGFVQAKDYNNNGKNLALAGIIISAIPIVLGIFFSLFRIIVPSNISPYFDI